MGTHTVPAFKIVSRSCLSAARRYRGIATVSGGSNRTVPLRIFATENVGDQGYTNLGFQTSAKDEKERRYQEWLQTRIAQSPPNERLSRELKSRVGKSRPRGLKRAVDLIGSQPENGMIRRTRSRRDTIPILRIDPSELIRPPKAADSEDAIYNAIGNCIGAAVDRLELYHQQQDTRDLANTPISIPHDQYMWLSSILQFQFSKQQLIGYGTRAGLKSSLLQQSKTVDVIALLLERIWSLEKEPELPPDETLVTKSVCRS
jgi:hypothetical protein